jgi:5-methylcytosine-specific restriction endonuclease McrA
MPEPSKQVMSNKLKLYFKNYNKKNKEHLIKYRKEYYIKNQTRIKSKTQEWQKNNPEKYKLLMEKCYLRNKENYIKRAKKWSKENPLKMTVCRFNWRRNNPLKIKEYSISRRKLGIPNIKDLQKVYELNIIKYGTLTCVLCEKPIAFGEDSIEHLLPLTRGGTNELENLGIAHKKCNFSKNNKTMEEWKNYRNKKREYA